MTEYQKEEAEILTWENLGPKMVLMGKTIEDFVKHLGHIFTQETYAAPDDFFCLRSRILDDSLVYSEKVAPQSKRVFEGIHQKFENFSFMDTPNDFLENADFLSNEFTELRQGVQCCIDLHNAIMTSFKVSQMLAITLKQNPKANENPMAELFEDEDYLMLVKLYIDIIENHVIVALTEFLDNLKWVNEALHLFAQAFTTLVKSTTDSAKLPPSEEEKKKKLDLIWRMATKNKGKIQNGCQDVISYFDTCCCELAALKKFRIEISESTMSSFTTKHGNSMLSKELDCILSKSMTNITSES